MTFNCNDCGAPMPPYNGKCEYCGSFNYIGSVTDIKPKVNTQIPKQKRKPNGSNFYWVIIGMGIIALFVVGWYLWQKHIKKEAPKLSGL